MVQIIRQILFGALVLSAVCLWTVRVRAGDKISSDCKFNGQKLYGKVQIVNNFPDFKVEVVQHFPVLKVHKINSVPDSCGKWLIVDHFPHFKVQIVQNFGDFKIQFVDNFPGL